MTLTFTDIPRWADNSDFPARAQTLEQARLPFYCCNCYGKAPTAYVTPNFGPFCAECLKEIEPMLNRRLFVRLDPLNMGDIKRTIARTCDKVCITPGKVTFVDGGDTLEAEVNFSASIVVEGQGV